MQVHATSGATNDNRGDLLALRNGVIGRVIAAGLLACAFAGTAATMTDEGWAYEDSGATAAAAQAAEFEAFLDRLMRAESNGHAFAANPRSTALGPFQFIKSTFIDLTRRHFPELARLGDEEVLALRTDHGVARRAAAIYSMESLAYLTEKGLKPTFGDLRLAYLVGPYAAARVLQAPPQTPASDLLGAQVVKANPFMRGMSASQLIARSARDVGEHRASVPAVDDDAAEPRERPVAVQPAPRLQPRPEPKTEVGAACNRKLAMCRRWIAMQANKQRVLRQLAAQRAAKGPRAASRVGRPGV